jgi:hypothetical protein
MNPQLGGDHFNLSSTELGKINSIYVNKSESRVVYK